jgi:pimeloyl-ACP methyl ester carboxylesterase
MKTQKMTYLLIPGAWAGDWIWDKVALILRDRGHGVHTLTLSGLRKGEDALNVRLETHVQDVLTYIESNQLDSVVLVGHSYSGVVVGQVAAKAPHLIARTVFFEAFLPVDGKSLLEVSGLDVDHEKSLITANNGLWPAPTLDELKGQPLLTAEQIKFLATKQIDHPGRTVTDPAVLATPLSALRATFVSEKGWLSSSRESDLIVNLRQESKWEFKSIEGGHWPMLTMPDQLSNLLQEASA